MPKPGNKELNTPTSIEQKEDTDSDGRVKEIQRWSMMGIKKLIFKLVKQ